VDLEYFYFSFGFKKILFFYVLMSISLFLISDIFDCKSVSYQDAQPFCFSGCILFHNEFMSLDTFLNVVNNKSIKRSSKLELAVDGYYLLFGISVLEFKFLHAISYALGESVNQIKNKIIVQLKKDDNLFISLNSGDIINRFGTKKQFINFIQNCRP
jgi:hypothetical protein